MLRRQLIFHPVTVLVVSILAAATFALFIHLTFTGDFRWFLLYYFVPVGIPFVAFLFDRAEQAARTSTLSWAIDITVVIPALTRAFVRLPLVSGHALFLSYCFLTSRSALARIAAVLVLLQVAYLKLLVTQDHALFGGVAVGYLAALAYRQVKTVKRDSQVETSL